MNKEVCIVYLDQAIASLHKMRIAVSDLPPDAAVDFLVAAQEVADMLGKSVTRGMWTINETKHE